MTATMQRQRSFRPMEGKHVSVSLSDGTRLDRVKLISAGHGDVATLWIQDGQDDRFVKAEDIVDMWQIV